MTSKSEMFCSLENAGIISKEEREVIESILNSQSIIMAEKEKEQNEKSNGIIISKILREIGISCSLLGYDYIKASIIMGLDEPIVFRRITKELYPRVAKQFGTTPSRVERAIRHAIENAWDRGNVKILHNIFGYSVSAEKGKPTNSEFLATVVEYIKINLL